MVPRRVLRVVGRMDRGGIETSIMQVLRRLDLRRFPTDFLYVDPDGPSIYDDEIRSLGLNIHQCSRRDVLRFASNFRRIQREFGPYTVVHSSLFRSNGYIAKVAAANAIPIRIVHSHSDNSTVDSTATFPRRLYIAMQNSWIQKYATSGLAISSNAAMSLYGKGWQSDSRWKLYREGRDLREYEQIPDREAVRAEFGLSNDAYVIGHVGRIGKEKNHAFLIQIFEATLARSPKAKLLLVGDGPLRGEVWRQVQQRGLENSVVMAGDRSDVSRILLGAVDVFVMPSIFEGLPLALVEAQASGLPCVYADTITEEATLVKPLVQRLSLTDSLEKWVTAILSPTRIDRREALDTVRRSPFNLENSVRALEAEYAAEIHG